MYSTSVSTKLKIDNSGTKIEKLDINVDGYRDESRLSEVMKGYKKHGETEKEIKYYENDWRRPLWYSMFYDMRRRLQRWKHRKF